MNEIRQQIASAKLRLNEGRFFSTLGWSMFAGLLLAAIAILIPKIWHLGFLKTGEHHQTWVYSWVLGGAVLALLFSAMITWLLRPTGLEAAVEVDKRFGLKERLSSALSLSESERESSAGQALISDAAHQAETIDVRDQFPLQPSARALLPLIPIAIVAVLLFVPNATEKVAMATEPEQTPRKQIEVAIKEFKKKAEEKKKNRLAKGLKDADPELKSLEKKFDELLKDKNEDRKNTFVKLNDIKKQIADRKKELGDGQQLRENLNKLKDVSTGPAKKLSDAMSKGDLKEAKKAIEELANKLKEGKMSDAEQKQLAKDLNMMAKELQKIAQKHEQAKQKLQDQLQKALDEGDLDKAAQLQQKLDQKQQQDQQMKKMQKMAQKLQKCANCMKPGDGNGQPKQGQQNQSQPNQNGNNPSQAIKEAGDSLEDLKEQIEQMQQELEEMDDLEDMEDLAQQCKNCMNGGDAPNENGKPQWQDWAQGAGNGAGKRDMQEDPTGGFKSRVKGKLMKGETVITGNADGENITGRSVSETRELVKSSMSKESDPIENQRLPKSQREHAQQYFELLRDND